MRRSFAVSLLMAGVAVVWVVLVAMTGSALAGSSSRAAGNGLIVYVKSISSGLFVVDPTTRATRRVTTGRDLHPTWSPDGRQIAFVRVAGPVEAPSWDGQASAIYVMNADGSGLRRVTDASVPVGWPDWSPDGKRIAFTRADGNGERGIYIVNADGSRLRRVPIRPTFVMRVSWSSTGLLAHDADGSVPDIWTVRPDGSRPRRITFDQRSLWPAWSPDGRRIAYVRGDSEATLEIYVMGANGTRPVRLTNNGMGDRDPAWSPDGQRIAYVRWVPNPEGGAPRTFLQLMNSDGSHSQRLVPAAGFPDWQPVPR